MIVQPPAALITFGWVFLVVICATCIGIMIDVWAKHGPTAVLVLVILVPGALYSWRINRSAVPVDNHGLLFRDVFDTKRLDRSKIHDFIIEPAPRLGIRIHAITRGGGKIALDVSWRLQSSKPELEPAVTELRASRSAKRDAGTAARTSG